MRRAYGAEYTQWCVPDAMERVKPCWIVSVARSITPHDANFVGNFDLLFSFRSFLGSYYFKGYRFQHEIDLLFWDSSRKFKELVSLCFKRDDRHFSGIVNSQTFLNRVSSECHTRRAFISLGILQFVRRTVSLRQNLIVPWNRAEIFHACSVRDLFVQGRLCSELRM